MVQVCSISVLFGSKMAHVEPKVVNLSTSWSYAGHLGRMLGHLGPMLSPSWAKLAPCWAMLGPSWAKLAASWAKLRP
eukprot:5028221-Karenia_brevis.AAC.1